MVSPFLILSHPKKNPRYGFANPVNYNDNELYCGGFSVQWDQVRINDTSKNTFTCTYVR